jgi:hypothetical protein
MFDFGKSNSYPSSGSNRWLTIADYSFEKCLNTSSSAASFSPALPSISPPPGMYFLNYLCLKFEIHFQYL